VQGLDREGYQNLASMCELDYPSYEIVVAMSDANDPVIPQIQRLQQEFPKTNIRLIIGVEELGISPKMNNLCRLVNEAKYDLLVINDSDVRVEKDYLRDVVAPFADPKVGVILKASEEDACRISLLHATYAGRPEASATKRISIIHDSVLRG
jgi:ceramide glucosyltransferase